MEISSFLTLTKLLFVGFFFVFSVFIVFYMENNRHEIQPLVKKKPTTNNWEQMETVTHMETHLKCK